MTDSLRQGRAKQPHPLKIRDLEVCSVTDVSPRLRRVTVVGTELDDFVSTGPTDHLKVFFPDPVTGVLVLPVLTADGLRSPLDTAPVSRDLTPRAFRPVCASGGAELDLDLVVHGGPRGPAGHWVATARPGDRVVIAGPKSSKTLPLGYARFVLVGDESALPAIARWLELLPVTVAVEVIAQVSGAREEPYLDGLRASAGVTWLNQDDEAADPTVLVDAIRAAAIGEDTFVWCGGEAGALVPVRRYLRRELGLGAAQAQVQGYWRRGVGGFDHHAPIDPTDPD